MKNKTSFCSIIIFLTIFILTISCKKDAKNTDLTSTPSPNDGIIFNPNLTYGTVIDSEGNIYKTINIGTQIWMAENLKATRYRNGDTIPNVTDSATWPFLTFGAYCNYNNDTNIAVIYGRLYNWFAITDSRNVCPTGWHVPSHDEWTTMFSFIFNSNSEVGGQMKETGYIHWNFPNTGATNYSGFTGLPGGSRSYSFKNLKNSGWWWDIDVWNHILSSNYTDVIGTPGSKTNGYSVRCIKD